MPAFLTCLAGVLTRGMLDSVRGWGKGTPGASLRDPQKALMVEGEKLPLYSVGVLGVTLRIGSGITERLERVCEQPCHLAGVACLFYNPIN